MDQFSDDPQARTWFSLKSKVVTPLKPPSTLSTARRHRRWPRRRIRSHRGSRGWGSFITHSDATAALSSWAISADQYFATNKVKCNIDKTVLMYATNTDSEALVSPKSASWIIISLAINGVSALGRYHRRSTHPGSICSIGLQESSLITCIESDSDPCGAHWT